MVAFWFAAGCVTGVIALIAAKRLFIGAMQIVAAWFFQTL